MEEESLTEVLAVTQWQDRVLFLLFASYALLSAIALIQLFRIQRRVPEHGWTVQKVFHLMNFIVNAVRATEFGFHGEVFPFKTKVFTLVLLDLPVLLFFSTYTLLILFWADIIYEACEMTSVKPRTIYLSVNAVIYAIQPLLSWLFLAVYYGVSLFNMLRSRIESKGRCKKLCEVGWVTGICFTCFLVRCNMRLFSALYPDLTLDVLNHPILDLFYYMFTEVVPMALLLFILRRLPRKRVSVQYSQIQ